MIDSLSEPIPTLGFPQTSPTVGANPSQDPGVMKSILKSKKTPLVPTLIEKQQGS